MSQLPEAVLFDVDGVLIDSLAAHLTFCADRARKFDENLKMPTAEDFRLRVQGGQKVSPMRDFFMSVGFPEARLADAVADYETKFRDVAKLKLFDGVSEMLATLRNSGIKLGFITSNVRNNVEPVLKEVSDQFEPAASFFYDPKTSKAQQIVAAARALNVDIARCVFVGDQPADRAAAREAGARFVGVTYGWGFAGEQTFETAENVYAIPMAVQRAAYEFSGSLQFDYAWKWFNYHADQRVKMFNYMFVGLGLFATALTGTLGKGVPWWVPVALCFFASLLAVIFALIDGRNQRLVRLGEDVLFELESSAIFGKARYIKGRSKPDIPFGILRRQEEEDTASGAFRKILKDVIEGRHRILLRAIAMLLAIAFSAAGLLLIYGHVEKMPYGD
jgi:HAD superfamily hydrolase (TIGR01549 family)